MRQMLWSFAITRISPCSFRVAFEQTVRMLEQFGERVSVRFTTGRRRDTVVLPSVVDFHAWAASSTGRATDS